MKTFHEVVNELADYIRDDVQGGIDVANLAESLLSEKDRADEDDEINIEVPARYTRSGNPICLTVNNYQIKE